MTALTLLEEVAPNFLPSGRKVRRGRYACICGGEKVASMDHVKRGLTKSCGCLARIVRGNALPRNETGVALAKIARDAGMRPGTLIGRRWRGVSVEQALATPVRPYRTRLP